MERDERGRGGDEGGGVGAGWLAGGRWPVEPSSGAPQLQPPL